MPEPPENNTESKHRNRENEDAELIFTGVAHVNEDAEILFIRAISNSKPVISNLLSRVTLE